jgi:ribonuclease P protein component
MATTFGRLRAGREFDTAFQEGSATSGPLFVVRARRNGSAQTRCAVAVGKRIAPLATTRNRAKRRIRAALREHDLPAGVDVVVIAKSEALAASYPELKAALAESLRRAEKQLS